MTHDETTSRLPWYLAGSLDADEAAAVRSHLDECRRCRAELEVTRAAARIHAAAHPTPDELVDAGWGRLDPDPQSAVDDHLETCPECREELALVRASRLLEAETGESAATAAPPTARRETVASRRWLSAFGAIAASVALLLVAFTVFANERQRLRAEMSRLETEVATTREAAARAEERAARLEGRVAELLVPRAGVPVVELLPETLLRGPASPGAAVVRRGVAPFVVLLVALERPHDHTAFAARLIDASGEPHFVSPPAAPDATGALTVLVPTASLPLGDVSLEVVGGEAGGPVVGRYRVSIEEGDESQPKTTNGAQ